MITTFYKLMSKQSRQLPGPTCSETNLTHIIVIIPMIIVVTVDHKCFSS